MKYVNKVIIGGALTFATGGGLAGTATAEIEPNMVYEHNLDDIQQTHLDIGDLVLRDARIKDNLSAINILGVSSSIIEAPQAKQMAERGKQVQIVAPPPPPPPPIPHFQNWLDLAQCESNSTWDINTGNGYYGGLQFSQTSWANIGGLDFAQRADLATPVEQMLVAENLLAIQGFKAWPGCSKKLGLI